MTKIVNTERRLVAIFAADVEGYSRLMAADEVGTLRDLTQRRDILDGLISSYRGRIANTAGDSVLAEFGSAVDAVQCAVEAQAALSEANAGVSPDRHINFRIGVHVGDIMIKGGDLFGDSVNVAARLQTLASAGGVCVSGVAHDQVKKILPFAFADLGAQQVKNIDEPVRAFALVAERAALLTASANALTPLALPDKPSIAVLPFQNISGDPEQEYFADGIVEDIITALSRFPSLFVIARNSCFTYKGKAVDVRKVGRELGVRYVLEGSVRKAGGRIRITAQLIDARSNVHLWAEKLDGELNDLFELQDELTTKIVSSVSLKLERAEFERVKLKATVDLDAYDLYQKAMALLRYDRRYDEAYNLFCKSFSLDPGFAAAYAMAATALFNPYIVLGTSMPSETRAEAIRLAETAAALPREDAYAMARAAHLLTFLGRQYDLGKELADHAVALNPSLGFAWLARGWVYVTRGEGKPAIESFCSVLRLDPLDPSRPIAWTGLGCAHNALAEYDKGYEWARRAIEAVPAMYTFAYFVINAVPYGRVEEARDVAAKMLKLRPDLTVSDALGFCNVRDQEWFERMRNVFREAGLPG